MARHPGNCEICGVTQCICGITRKLPGLTLYTVCPDLLCTLHTFLLKFQNLRLTAILFLLV